MPRAVGHLDKRTRVSRCQPCARRRIKCDGQIPCRTCVRLGKVCIAQQPRKSQHVEFVTVVVGGPTPRAAALSHSRISYPMNAQSDDLFQDHFVRFLCRCHFTKHFADLAPDILQLLPATGPLLDIALAIGALETSRKGSVRVRDKGEDPKRASLVLYGRSIRTFRDEIATPGFQPAEKTLWITFLLGLFELMSETSSTEAWSMHMIQGLGQVIRYMTLIAEPIRLTKELLNIYRSLEISRTILYGTDTMLAPGHGLGRSDASDCPKLVMSQELMLEASLLSHRMFREVSTCTHGSAIATAWASQGMGFFRKLRDAQLHFGNPSIHDDPFEKLAVANCCALCLYFCRNFSYFTAFAGLETPTLTADETENLISTILDQLDTLLLRQEVHGVFLLYPLRVAGASARSTSEKSRIIKALKDVYMQGLAVSAWIVTDLQHLWEWQENL